MRTFTVHQLEALVTERIRSALHTYASRILIASGFLHNLYDEDVDLREAWRIFRKALAHLRALADAGTLVLVVCPAPTARGEPGRTIRLPDRDRMLETLIATADRVVKLDATTLCLEKSAKTVRALRVVSPAELPNLDSRQDSLKGGFHGTLQSTKPHRLQTQHTDEQCAATGAHLPTCGHTEAPVA